MKALFGLRREDDWEDDEDFGDDEDFDEDFDDEDW